MKIYDIICDESFFEDWKNIPDEIKKRFDSKVDNLCKQMDEKGWTRLLNSFNAHEAKNVDDHIWIGYLTQGRQGWRILFDVDSCGVLHFIHIFTHAEMEYFFKNAY